MWSCKDGSKNDFRFDFRLERTAEVATAANARRALDASDTQHEEKGTKTGKGEEASSAGPTWEKQD